MHYETIWSFNTAQFRVTLAVAPCQDDPADSFCTQEDIDAVHEGRVEWFDARPRPGKRGRVTPPRQYGANPGAIAMSNKYTKHVERHDHTEIVFDMDHFARDFAEASGGTYKRINEYPYVILGDCRLGFHQRYNEPDKVLIDCSPHGTKLSRNDWPYVGSRLVQMPSAKVSVDRDMSAIVKDVQRRVVDQSVEPFKLVYAKENADQKQAADMAQAIADFKRITGLEATAQHNETYRAHFSVYQEGGDHRMSGYVYADGTVSIERMSSVNMATTKMIWDAIQRRNV
jgi:hypothetical protein